MVRWDLRTLRAIFQIGRPSVSELPSLGTLCLRSKAVWGYDQVVLEACPEELTFDEAELSDSYIGVAVADGDVVGVVQVRSGPGHADLEKIFVEPHHCRIGFGRLMFDWAVASAQSAGARRLVVHADPSAASFYRARGLVAAGEAPSGSKSGRMLPRLTLSIAG